MIKEIEVSNTFSETYYTAKQAREKLELTQPAFQGWVRDKKVVRRMLPGRKQGLYLKHEIDALVQRRDQAIRFDQAPSLIFRRATIEDVPAEQHLAVLVFGQKANNPDNLAARKRFLEHNPDMTWQLYDDGNLVSSMNLVPIVPSAVPDFKDGKRGWLFDLSEIEQFVPGKPLNCIIIDFMNTPEVGKDKQTYYAEMHMRGMARQLAAWGSQGIEIANIYACGGTSQGREILTNAKFTYLGEARPGRHMYALNVAESKLKVLAPYKRALTQFKRKH
jgi:hypothetical protein